MGENSEMQYMKLKKMRTYKDEYLPAKIEIEIIQYKNISYSNDQPTYKTGLEKSIILKQKRVNIINYTRSRIK